MARVKRRASRGSKTLSPEVSQIDPWASTICRTSVQGHFPFERLGTESKGIETIVWVWRETRSLASAFSFPLLSLA